MSGEERRLQDEVELNSVQGEGVRMINVVPEGYFEREIEENLREQGYPCKEVENYYGSVEYTIRKAWRDRSQDEDIIQERRRKIDEAENIANPCKGTIECEKVYDGGEEWIPSGPTKFVKV